jgi:hypothetical protein
LQRRRVSPETIRFRGIGDHRSFHAANLIGSANRRIRSRGAAHLGQFANFFLKFFLPLFAKIPVCAPLAMKRPFVQSLVILK